MSSITRMNNLMNDFTLAEKKIARFLLDNTEKIYHMTAAELAGNIGSSPASIIRFSQKLGYEGLNELKIALAKDMPYEGIDEEKIYEKITIHDSLGESVNKIAAESIKAIKDTAKLIDERSVMNAVKAISSARRINLYGVGSSALVAKDLHYKLVRIAMPADMHTDHHLQLVSAANISKEDVAIAFSHSGKSVETFKAIEMSKLRGATTISVTKFGKNPISELSDINIYTTEVERTLRMGAIASRIAQLTIVDILFIEIVKYNFSQIPEHIKQTSDILKAFKLDK